MKGSRKYGRKNSDLNKDKSKSRAERKNSAARPSSIKLKRREFFMLIFFSALLLFLIYRVGHIQFVKGKEYQELAYLNQTQKRQINPKRGTIYDRNGKGLAISASVDTVAVNPKELRDEVKGDETKLLGIANELASILEMDSENIMKRFKANTRFEFIKKRIDREIGSEVRSFVAQEGLKSIYIDEDSKRYYPKGSLASHILGWVGDDHQGLNGIELVLESTLQGMPGKIMNEVDVLGRQISFSKERYVDAVDGYDVYLTIDETIQYLTEKAMDRAMLDYNLKGGATAIVMDPHTGEVLAMVSKPDFDPNDPGGLPSGIIDDDWKGFNDPEDSKFLWQTVFRNTGVMDTYEPGSVFKAITTAIAIEENVIDVSTPTVCKPYSLAGHTINCWRKGGHGPEDFLHAVYNSCNPVFVDVAMDIGIEKFYNYFRLFGFKDRTGIELQGEPSKEEFSKVQHTDPKDIDMAVTSFGQRFQITPLQMITAYCAIANGGSLMEPTIIKQISDNDGNIIKKFEPKVVRKVISEQTAATVREILEGVVSDGTGKNAYVPGYRIAGKTGTSQTLQTDSEGRYIVSFGAIAPANKPKICVLVVLDHPQNAMHLRSGGILAAPTAGKLTEEILEYLQVEREFTEKDKIEMAQEVYVPNVVGLTIEEAAAKLKAFGLKYMIEGNQEDPEAVIHNQTPKADFLVPQSSTIIVYTDPERAETIVTLPDFTDNSVAEVLDVMKRLGLNLRIRGSGVAQKQQYPAGTMLRKGELVEVSFVEMIGD